MRLDSLGINAVVVEANTVDLDGKSGIEWNDPAQILVFSPDGRQRTQITDNEFFTSTWIVNRTTGTIVVTGYYDTNSNKQYDKTDKNEIDVYDLKTLKLLYKI